LFRHTTGVKQRDGLTARHRILRQRIVRAMLSLHKFTIMSGDHAIGRPLKLIDCTVIDDDDVAMLAGLVQLFSKSGGVISSIADNLVHSSDTQKAMTFQLVSCRAWDWLPDDVRPRCFSLMDASRPGWYVRHRYDNLRVEAEYDTEGEWTPQLFQKDSSFLLHVDSFYPGNYALEFVTFPNNYAWLSDDGYMLMQYNAYTPAYTDAASFKLYQYNASRTYQFFGGANRAKISCKQ